MSYLTHIGCAFLAFLPLICIGQNLVQNPSFESTRIVDSRWCPSAENFDDRMKVWTSPTLGSPDILFDRLIGKMWPHRPFLSLTNCKPRTGRLMVGIRVYGCERKGVHCKEYIQVPFKLPMKPGNTYLIEYWVRPLDNSIRVNKLGFALSRGPVIQRWTREEMTIEPAYETDSIVARKHDDWVPVVCQLQRTMSIPL